MKSLEAAEARLREVEQERDAIIEAGGTFEAKLMAYQTRFLTAEKERDDLRDQVCSYEGAPDWQRMYREVNAQVRAALEAAERVALTRPHDGSQLDSDLEALLLTIKAVLARTQAQVIAH